MFLNIIDTLIIFFLVNLILFSYIGYGTVLFKIINYKFDNLNVGYIGIAGCFLLIFISYITIFITAHNSLHNIIIIAFGIFFFFFYYFPFLENKNLKFLIFFILITFSFFLI